MFLQGFLLCVGMAIVVGGPEVRDHGLVEERGERGGHLFHLCSEDAFGKILTIGENQVYGIMFLRRYIGPQ